MPYLIDGHNLIGQTPGLALSDPEDEQKLILLLRAFLVRTNKKGTVIFDKKGLPGGGGKWSNNVLEVRFAPLPKTADDLIRERLENDKNARGLVVVSADQEVMAAARRAGAAVKNPVDFAGEMLAGPKKLHKKETGLTEAEVAEWERAFRERKK